MTNRYILLRFDDICPTMNWEQWNKAKLLLDKAGVTALLGVVPDCTDPELNINTPRVDFWDYIRGLQEQGYAIAMHGFNHQFTLKANGLVTTNKISEFAGETYEVQLEKIKKGKEILHNHGIETDIFFAPAHSYDDNTLKALAICGFKYMSDGYSCKPYIRNGIKLIPCRSGGIPRLRRNDGCITAIIHAHEWTGRETGIEWNRFLDVMTNHSSEIVSFNQFAEWKCGNSFFQRIYERVYFLLKQHIAPLYLRLVK